MSAQLGFGFRLLNSKIAQGKLFFSCFLCKLLRNKLFLTKEMFVLNFPDRVTLHQIMIFYWPIITCRKNFGGDTGVVFDWLYIT